MTTSPARRGPCYGALAAAASLIVLAGPAAGATRAPGAVPPAGTISEFGGGVGGPGPAASVAIAPCGVTQAPKPCDITFGDGRLFFTDIGENNTNAPRAGNVIRSIDLHTGQLTTPAGDGVVGITGDGGLATAASLRFPAGQAVDGSGNLLIAEFGNARIRVAAAATGTFYQQAMTAGHLYTVAGNGTNGIAGDGGPALAAQLDLPESIALDHAGNLVIGEHGGFPFGSPAAVRVVAESNGTFYGQSMTAGDIYKVAGRLKPGIGIGDGGPAAKAFLGGALGPVLVDSAGNLVIADTGTNGIRVIAAKTGTFYGTKMTVGDIYTVAGGGSAGAKNGVPAKDATLTAPTGLAIDAAGNLVVQSASLNVVRVVAVRSGTFYGQKMTAHDIYTIAGGGTSLQDGALGTKAKLTGPSAMAVDSAGNVAIADRLARRLRVLAATSGTFYGRKMLAGHLYSVAGNGQTWLSGDGRAANRAQLFPSAEAVDSNGNLLVADSASQVSRCKVRVVAAKAGTFYGQKMTARNIYTIAGAGPVGFSGDGGPALRASFTLTTRSGQQGGLAVDATGNVIIGDAGNNRIRVIAVRSGTFYGQTMIAHHVYTIAGGGTNRGTDGLGDGGPATKAALNTVDGAGVAVGTGGTVIISDSEDNLVRAVAVTTGTFYGVPMKAGNIYVIAGGGNPSTGIGDGGRGTKARLNLPGGIAVDAHGNVAIVDRDDDGRIRVLAATSGMFYGITMTAGHIYTVGGGGTGAIGGPAVGAAIDPAKVAVDQFGNLVITSTGSSQIRMIAVQPGTFYGVPMTAGNVYNVAGTSTFGFSGDGGPATAAQLAFPEDAVVNQLGDIVIADSNSFRLRVVQS